MASDIRDIMDLGQAGPRPPAPKKKKGIVTQRIAGVTREVQALMGDSVPPIAIVEQKLYKSKPSIAQKLFRPRHWDERSFQHGARSDGLVLRHWKRSIPGSNRIPAAPSTTTPTDVEMTDGEKEPTPVVELRFEDEFPSEKWNIKVDVPFYTDEQYENSFKVEDWTREETDYLMDLCRDFDLRWLLIADRYDPKDILVPPPPTVIDGTELAQIPQYPPRPMEALKSRYYTVAAKLLEAQTPASNMTQAEFQLWEKMRNFDAKTETLRKNMAEKLFERTKDEADEERLLLEELHRITKNEEDFIKMRRDLYSRLEPAPAIRRTERGEEQSTAMYQTSAGLSMLLQTLLAKEKRLKRPPMPNGVDASGHPSASDAQKWEKGRHPNQYTRRDTMDSQADEGPQKKGSISQPVVRVLTPAEESKFGVAHPQERLTSGVQFRHEKINRLTMAKSQVQTSKIQAALTELGIPPRLLMPTERVCREFERLVGEINLLLDARKVNEKVASEIKVLEEARRIRLGIPKEGDGENERSDAMEVDTSQITAEPNSEGIDKSAVGDEDRDAEGEDDDDDADGEKDEDANDRSSMQVDDQEDDEDGEGEEDEEDEDDDVAVEKSEVMEDDEDEEVDESLANLGKDDDDEEEAEEDEDEEDDEEVGVAEEDEDDEENDEGDEEEDDAHPAPRADASDEEEADEEEDDNAEVDASAGEDNDEDEEEEDDEEEDAAAAAAAPDDDDEEEEEEEEEDDDDDEEEGDAGNASNTKNDEEDDENDDSSEPSRPVSSHSTAAPLTAASRIHKRSASVISDTSKAGSNRSGFGRKKRR